MAKSISYGPFLPGNLPLVLPGVRSKKLEPVSVAIALASMRLPAPSEPTSRIDLIALQWSLMYCSPRGQTAISVTVCLICAADGSGHLGFSRAGSPSAGGGALPAASASFSTARPR